MNLESNNHDGIKYLLKREKETLGGLELEIDCLADLNQTIDQVFLHLEKSGNPQDLEKLCPYFGVIWPAARGLSEYLSELPSEKLTGCSVLEVGCGLALPSMVAAKRGAHVLATDYHPEVPRFLSSNIRNNQLSELKYQRIDWESGGNHDLGVFDWVIGSDVLYESRYAQTLSQRIRNLLKPQGKIILADPGRPYLQAFVDLMKNYGFECETKIYRVPHPPNMQEVFVLIFQRM